MGKPEDNPDGYWNSSVLAHCASLQGRLLIVHGVGLVQVEASLLIA